MIQKEMFRTSVLAKVRGCLVLMRVKPGIKKPGKCLCGAVNFTESKGWTSCDNDDCDLELLTAHVKEIDSQWA